MRSLRVPPRSITCFATLVSIAVCLAVGVSGGLAATPEDESRAAFDRIEWETAPSTGKIGDVATIQIPAGCMFTGRKGARDFMIAGQNPPSGEELGIIFHPDSAGSWFVIFIYDAIGHVKDDEKDRLDADAILSSIRKGTEEANKERTKRGWDPVSIVGWARPPAYDPATHDLMWSIIGRSSEGESINHSTRVLGRRGVMSVELVCGREEYERTLSSFSSLLEGFDFIGGERYAEFRAGDKVAAVGLTGLILGGAAVAAVKTGFFAKFIKPILIGLLIALGAIWRVLVRLFRRLSGREDAGSGS